MCPPSQSNLHTLNVQATLWRPWRLRLLWQGGEASTMTRSEASTQWNGAISLLSMLGAGRKSSITQLSSFFLWLSTEDLSGPRGGFISARTKCLGARKSMRKRIWAGITRSTQKKPAAIAALQSNFIPIQTLFWGIIWTCTFMKSALPTSLTCGCQALPMNKLDQC